MLWNCSTHNATLVLAGVPFSSFCLAWCRRTRGKRASTVFSCHSRDLIANYIILRTNLSEFCRCHPLASRHATTPAGKQAYLTVGGNTTSRRHISQRVDSLQEGQGAFLSRISSNSLPYSNSGRDGDEPTNGSLFFLPLPNHLVGTFFSTFTMSSSEQIAYQMRRMSLASDCSSSTSSVPPPPEMLALSAKIMSEAAAGFDLDCSQFTMTPSASRTSLDSSYSGASAFSQGSLTRSHCVTSNLSTFGSSPPSSTHLKRHMPQQVSTPNHGWGYFVDSVDR